MAQCVIQDKLIEGLGSGVQMDGTTPVIFISSTCKDFKQVRDDISLFVRNELGYVPMLSEDSGFPVDPGLDTTGNCLQNVRRHADILLLVIGGRYGNVDDESQKSVTHLEYLTAKDKGIPIYVLIEREVLILLSAWKKNPLVDFSFAVDDPRVFSLIDDIRSTERTWTHEFDNASDIIDHVRAQLAALVAQLLAEQLSIKNSDIGTDLNGLSSKARAILVAKPTFWEVKLLAQVLEDELKRFSDIKRSYKLGMSIGDHFAISEDEINKWISQKMQSLMGPLANLGKLINTALNEAIGPAGRPGDASYTIYVARHMSIVYKQAIEWSLDLRRAVVPDTFRRAQDLMFAFPDNIIKPIEKFGQTALSAIDEALANGQSHVQIVLNLIPASENELFDALEAASKEMLSRRFNIDSDHL